jgi:hypothetical protein
MTTIDDSLSEIRSLRNDIWRCRKLLQTDLPDAEREKIEKRLLERRSAFEGLLATTFPLVLKLGSSTGETRLAVNFQEVVHSASDADVAKQTSRGANEETVRTGRKSLAGDANRKDTRASREIARTDELGENRPPSWVMPAERSAEL